MFCESYTELYYYLFSPEAPSLLYYSHIPAVIVSLILAFFILYRNKNRQSVILSLIAIVFSIWTFFDLLLWTQVDSRLLMFLWSFWFTFFSATFVLSLYFLYVFITKKDASFLLKIVGTSAIVFPMTMSFTPFNLEYFDVISCNASEGSLMLNYAYVLSIIVFLAILFFSAVSFYKTKDTSKRKQISYISIGLILFLLSFGSTTYYASLLNLVASRPDTFGIEQYGYMGMTVFMCFLAFSVVKYKAFNVKLLATQALVFSLIVSVFSQIFFIDSPTGIIINVITIIITALLGHFLVKSVKKVDEQREALDRANKRQENLLHFISHQVKGFFTKSRNIFSGLSEGDYGPIPDTAKSIILEGFESDNRGVQTVQEILNASNIKTGEVTYSMGDTNIINIIKDSLHILKPIADKKGLVINFAPTTQNLIIKADAVQLQQAIKNLIDNSIKYTPSGKIDIDLSLNEVNKKAVIKISDTGVGINPEDMSRLFQEGGRGKNSIKVNVDSTGYGLYIVKNVIEAHGGHVTAFSEGEGKGSVFTVELPVK